ncbi:hypothetical protein [Vallitalea okinawensis]|uniref:hypothetical protein n=1 Tax=Vallitalea okinawensis TaxID=2078660 RepID=UPI000CFC813B|nr:hypothetical protein [Vallitalea okinawensis]
MFDFYKDMALETKSVSILIKIPIYIFLIYKGWWNDAAAECIIALVIVTLTIDYLAYRIAAYRKLRRYNKNKKDGKV